MSILDKASLIQIPSGYKNGKLYSVKPNPSYGSEQISNGDFSDGSTGWTVTNGTVTDKYNASMTAYQNGIKVTPFTLSGTYKLIFDLTITSGSCKFDGGGSNSQTYTTSGRKELTITNPTKFEFNAFNLGWVGTLDNVSVKEVLVADGDFTFARSSSGTRVNSEGLIEVASVLGSDLANGWDFTSGWNIFGGGTSITNSTTFVTGSGQGIYRGLGLLAGKKYKVSIAGTQPSGGYLTIRAGTTGTSFGDITTTNFDLELTASLSTVTGTGNNFYIRLANHSASTTITITKLIIKEVIENDVPRLDYSGGASCASLLLEPQRSNLITYSEDFTQWASSGVTITPNLAISPDGTQNASLFSHSGGSFPQIALSGITFVSSANYFPSLYVKSDGTTQLQHSLIVNGQVINFTPTDEWVRVSDLIVSPDTSGSFVIAQNSGSAVAASFYIWGAQLEQGSYPTSYIISNSGSQTTRTADVCNNAGTSATFNDSEGVLFFEGSTLVESGITRVISLSNGSTSNNIYFNFNQNANGFNCEVLSGGSTQFNASVTMTKVNNNKIALKYKANDFALWINGTEVATDTSGSAPSGLDRLNFDFGQGIFDFEGKCKQLMVFNEALSDEELLDLTGQVNLSFNNLATFYNYTIL